MSQTLRIHRKSLLSHHPAFSTGICQHQTAFPSTLPSMEIDDEEGFSTIRLQALRKVLINGKAKSIKYKSSQCEISSTNQFSHKGKRNARIAKLRIFCFKAVQSTGVASSYFKVSWAQIIKIKMYVKLLKSKCMWVEMIKIKMYLKLLKSKCM